jgi:hypothetical protein
MPDKISKSSIALIPPEGDKNVGKRVFEVLAAVLADKENLGLPKLWSRHYKLRRNKHWKDERSSVPLISANLIYTHVQRSVNSLTDNNPIFNVVNMYAGDNEAEKSISTDLQRAAEDWWMDNEQQDKLESSVLNGEMYGICIEKVIFNSELSAGLGDVETRIVDPFHFGWYPVKMADLSDLQGREAVLEFYVKSCRELAAKYPQFADKIKPDTDVLNELNDDRREINSDTKSGSANNVLLLVIQSVVRAVGSLFKSSSISELDNDETVVCEMWVRDKTTINDGDPQKDQETGKITQATKPKYTGEIRYILACSGGQVVLEDKDNPNINPVLDQEKARHTYLYSRFPYVAANSIKDTSNAWGISDIEDVDKLNIELNKSLSQLVLEKDQQARRKIINPRDSGVKNEELMSYPGILNPSTAAVAAGIKYLEVPKSNGDIEKSIELFKQLFLLIAGTFDLDQAETKSNVIAYKAIAALLERAATMMRGKIRSYSRLIRERGRMYISHVQNFYTEERWITYKEANGETAAKQIRGSDMARPVNLTVVTGSTLPISRVQQREEALALFSSGAIDQPELLEKLDWGNRNAVIRRMQAGPLGAIMEKLATVGVPDEIMEYLKGIAEADPKKLQQSLKKGEFPTFPELMKMMISENMGRGQAIAEEEAQAKPEQIEAQAKVKKLEAETALIAAKVQTEAVNQQVSLAGVQFDEESMQIDRAKAVHSMEKDMDSSRREDVKVQAAAVSALNNRPGFNERGKKSDNKQS